MNFLKVIFNSRNEAQAAERKDRDSAQDTYLRLIRRGAKDGQLSKADTAALDEAAQKLGYSAERIEADATILAQYHADSKIAPQRRSLFDAYHATYGELENFDRETNALSQKLSDERKALRAKTIEAKQLDLEAKLKAADAAVGRMYEVEHSHFALLGIEDPAPAEAKESRKRHLAWTPDGETERHKIQGATYPILFPNGDAFSISIFNAAEIIPLPGQTAEEIEDLKIVANNEHWCMIREDRNDDQWKFVYKQADHVIYLEDIEHGVTLRSHHVFVANPAQGRRRFKSLLRQAAEIQQKRATERKQSDPVANGILQSV